MSALHCVVVWEWQAESGVGGSGSGCGAWLPHGPGVARTLERAHAKRLTRVVLADADAALRGHTVNLRTLTQSSEEVTGGVVERRVRRACYSVHSPGGRGARWEWAGATNGTNGTDEYDPLPMGVQCLLEEAWAAGEAGVPLEGWAECLRRMQALGRPLRRAPQPPYPLARAPHAPPPPPQRLAAHDNRVATRIPHQHTGSSVLSVQSAHSALSTQSAPAGRRERGPEPEAVRTRGARSVSPKERRGLARQILHNLNIFASTAAAAAAAGPQREREGPRRPDSRAEERGARRHSVDTVSTYLSHESKDSLRAAGSVGELLDVSAGSGSGSDEAFEAEHVQQEDVEQEEQEGAPWWGWAAPVGRPQWGAVCPSCLAPLRPRGQGAAVLQLARCHHQLHQACLRAKLASGGGCADCLVCGQRYPPPPPAAPAPAQPPGSMAWSVQGAPLATHPGASTIVVTYNFQSGRQGEGHPWPGAPYYAVGFPRHSVLPDAALGRRVLRALRAAWAAGALFAVRASHTTGREHVVAWRAPPPPQTRDHYARLATQERADAVLASALARLEALLEPAALAGASACAATAATSV